MNLVEFAVRIENAHLKTLFACWQNARTDAVMGVTLRDFTVLGAIAPTGTPEQKLDVAPL